MNKLYSIHRRFTSGVGTKLTLRRRGPKDWNSNPRGPGFPRAYCPSHQVGGMQELCELLQWGPGAKHRGRQEFWCILSSSGELSYNTALQNCVCRPRIYEGRSKSFEPDYLPLDFWAKKCYWPSKGLLLVFFEKILSSVCLLCKI